MECAPKVSRIESLVPAAAVLREKLWGSDALLIDGYDGVLRVWGTIGQRWEL